MFVKYTGLLKHIAIIGRVLDCKEVSYSTAHLALDNV